MYVQCFEKDQYSHVVLLDLIVYEFFDTEPGLSLFLNLKHKQFAAKYMQYNETLFAQNNKLSIKPSQMFLS